MIAAVFFVCPDLGSGGKQKENAAGQNPQRLHIDGVMFSNRRRRQYLQLLTG